MDSISWGTAAPAVAAAFFASLVEVVEAFTIVLAVAAVRGVRPAIAGVLAGLLFLALLVLALGPVLDQVPIHLLQFLVGVLLLLFGMRWLRKAVLRAAGVIALHDETQAFSDETALLEQEARRDKRRAEWVAGLAAFKAVVLEGLEVVFIVIAVGAAHDLLLPAVSGPWRPAF
jgi:Ca2+/H+ antiporter, TMEM165/GDT1 family